MNFNETTMLDNKNTTTISMELTDCLRKRMRFIGIMQQVFGVLMIISGAFICVGIITAIVGIPVLLAGIKLYKSGSAFSLAAMAKGGEGLSEAINQLHGYWKMAMIIIIISISFYAIALMFMISIFLPTYYH